MLYNCIWESSLRKQLFFECSRRSRANTHQGKTFWKRLALHSRTRSNAFILLFMLFFCRVHYYAPLQHIAAKRRMWRCNSISRLLKWPIDIQKFRLILDSSYLQMNMWNLNVFPCCLKENVTWYSNCAWLHVWPCAGEIWYSSRCLWNLKRETVLYNNTFQLN